MLIAPASGILDVRKYRPAENSRRRSAPCMARNRSHEAHTFLAIRMDGFDVAVGTSVNIHLRGSIHYYLSDESPVFTPEFRIDLVGTCAYPESRAGDKYELTIYGERSEAEQVKVKDIRARDQNELPIYRTYRGRQVPVYKTPPGFASLERIRATRDWRASIWVVPRTARDMLLVLNESRLRPIYVGIHERKVDRMHWIQSLHVQTRDPAEE
jgi:hypothetical protein